MVNTDGYINGCRMCGEKDIEMFLDLGRHPLMNSLFRKEDLGKKEEDFPLEVGFCHGCHLVQLMYVVEAAKIYREMDYLFYSSDMPTLKEYFHEYVKELQGKYLERDDLVVEIGANDGILLALFEKPIRILGEESRRAATWDSRKHATIRWRSPTRTARPSPAG